MLFGTTLNRMIFAELVRVFLLALRALTGLFVLAGLIQQATQLGLSPAQVVRIVPLFIPSMLPYTIPATTLFASCVVYGRLAHDNEVVAVRGAGVHLFTILRPALLLGVLAAGLTGGLYYAVIPSTQQQLQEEILRDPEEVLYNALRRDRSIRHPTFPYALYVRDVQGRRLIDVVLKRRGKARDPQTGVEVLTGYDFVARAREARLRVDSAEGMLYIDPDRFLVYDPNVQGVTQSTGPVPVPLPENLTARDTRGRPTSLTWTQLAPQVEELVRERAEKERQRAEAMKATEALPEGPFKKVSRGQDAHYKAQTDNLTRLIRNTQAEYYMRPALAVGCLVFALIGCPVGLWAHRADYLSTFVICFLPTVFVYYPLLLAGSNMGKDGKLPLGLGCFAADIVLGGVGIMLTWRLLRR